VHAHELHLRIQPVGVLALVQPVEAVLDRGDGGGYGDPKRRLRERVLDDLRNGYVTEETARAVYGLDK